MEPPGVPFGCYRGPMLLLLLACTETLPDSLPPIAPPAAPWIPPHCYARLEPTAPRNPCYVCHQRGRRPHTLDDSALQIVYDLPQAARRNGWSNLFADRTDAIAALSDGAIDHWVRQPNLPRDSWGATFSFDTDGWDRDEGGGATGWRSYQAPSIVGYGPAHGSWGDALIRLPLPFRTDLERYRLNLAILDAVMARADVPIPATDERRVGLDLDLDGTLGSATQVTYRYAVDDRPMRWAAETTQRPTPGLFPEGTEFLHSVRYLDPGEPVRMAPHMKELRYMVKTRWLTMAELASAVASDDAERLAFPDRLDPVLGDATSGLSNGRGWRLRGWIETPEGDLRPQTLEELSSCTGCHGGIGRTVDSVFTYPRKQRWGHSDRLFEGPERVRGDGQGERTLWQRVGGGRYLGDPVTPGLPSAERARALNKAYRVIVAEQSFNRGREATWGLDETQLWRELEPGQPTGITAVVQPGWIRSTKR